MICGEFLFVTDIVQKELEAARAHIHSLSVSSATDRERIRLLEISIQGEREKFKDAQETIR
jgi:hypothetical protein